MYDSYMIIEPPSFGFVKCPTLQWSGQESGHLESHVVVGFAGNASQVYA
jgi:hypothetical protein